MNRFVSLRRTAAALVAVAILGFAHDTSADESRPFKGVAAAVVTGVEPVADGLLLTVAATGKATHLGKFTREESVVLHADGTVEGSLVFIAANGDRLYADVAGGFISPTTAVGTYTFTGGTGRFADASGAADWVGVTSDGMHLALTFEGTIKF